MPRTTLRTTLQLHRFDDVHEDILVHVTGMTIWTRLWCPVFKVRWIGGLKVSYSNGESNMYGGSHFDQKNEFYLNHDERIVKARLKSGMMIDSLELHTDQGRKLGPYGGTRGGKNPYDSPPPKATSGYLAGICGIVVKNRRDFAIRKLKFKWAYYDLA